MFDDAIVGAGILGLAHAYHLAKRGRRVVVFERSPRASGASVRNFGMLWPIGQPAGPMRRMARRSLEIWTEVLQAAGLWHERSGSLHLAYREDEAQVLRELTRSAEEPDAECAFLDPPQVLARSRSVRPDGLVAGMWSPTETCVDPREVIGGLPGWLERRYGVCFVFSAAVTGCEPPWVRAGGQQWRASRLYLCAGDDTETLFPSLLQDAGLVRCKLQMMRTQPYGDGWRLGPMLAGGLTLRHYASFRDCPSLPALKRRIAVECPEYDRYGIHVMASQNGRGEIVIGDSHEYGEAIEPFDKPEIDALILRYLETFLVATGSGLAGDGRPPGDRRPSADLRIAARWHGTYIKHPTEPYVVASPVPGVTVITAVGGAGMTLSFGLAEQVVNETLGEA